MRKLKKSLSFLFVFNLMYVAEATEIKEVRNQGCRTVFNDFTIGSSNVNLQELNSYKYNGARNHNASYFNYTTTYDIRDFLGQHCTASSTEAIAGSSSVKEDQIACQLTCSEIIGRRGRTRSGSPLDGTETKRIFYTVQRSTVNQARANGSPYYIFNLYPD